MALEGACHRGALCYDRVLRLKLLACRSPAAHLYGFNACLVWKLLVQTVLYQRRVSSQHIEKATALTFTLFRTCQSSMNNPKRRHNRVPRTRVCGCDVYRSGSAIEPSGSRCVDRVLHALYYAHCLDIPCQGQDVDPRSSEFLILSLLSTAGAHHNCVLWCPAGGGGLGRRYRKVAASLCPVSTHSCDCKITLISGPLTPCRRHTVGGRSSVGALSEVYPHPFASCSISSARNCGQLANSYVLSTSAAALRLSLHSAGMVRAVLSWVLAPRAFQAL